MEPQSIQPNYPTGNYPENLPVNPNNAPNIPLPPEAPLVSPEQSGSPEQLAVDHKSNAPATAVPASQPTPTATQPAPTIPVVDGVAAAVAATPIAAADNDTIEKEWVDKVKQVISSTADDPHKQQKYASQLMASYVLKRYGRKIGEAEE